MFNTVPGEPPPGNDVQQAVFKIAAIFLFFLFILGIFFLTI